MMVLRNTCGNLYNIGLLTTGSKKWHLKIDCKPIRLKIKVGSPLFKGEMLVGWQQIPFSLFITSVSLAIVSQCAQGKTHSGLLKFSSMIMIVFLKGIL